MFNITIFTWYLVNIKFDKISKLLLTHIWSNDIKFI